MVHAQILALGDLRQEDYCELQTSLGYRKTQREEAGDRKEGRK